MTKFIKRSIFLLLTFLVLFISIFIQLPMKSKATSYASKWAWRDENGNIIVRVEDKEKTSKIYYSTVGFTITRCILGTDTTIEDQYITIKLTGFFDSVDLGGGQIGTAFIFKEADMMAKIAACSGEWLADVQSGETCYLMIDSIMITINDNYPEPINYSGWMLSDTNQDYLNNGVNPHPGVYDKYTKDNLKKVYGWASPSSIDTHFRIRLLYNGGKEPEPVVSDEYVTTIGKDKPEYYTWNTSDEYDLSEGIPSGEAITNGYGADKWYGNVTIGKHEVEKEYALSYDFAYHVYSPIYAVNADGSPVYDGEGNRVQIGTTDDVYHIPKAYRVKRKASYYYVLGLNLYEIKQADVYNSVYPNDLIQYFSSGNSVPMEVELDGEKNPVSVSNWNTEEDKHIIWPEAHRDTIEIDCGEGIGSVTSKMEYLEQVLYDDEITEDDYIKGVTSWNDLVEVNGKRYLDNTHVTHAYDTSKVRIQYLPMTKGKDDTMYLFQEQQKTVIIPTNVANGSYATSIEVTYRRRSLNDGKTMVFSSNDSGDSIYKHLKPGFEKNEPVYVHTPVISPVTIKDGSDSTQLIHENKTSHTGMVDKDGRVPDGKAIYELLLDSEYTFQFDPALHREIQGYGWSGDPSKYDKYVKGKYVAFPFTCQVEKDGIYSDFYKIDNNTVDEEGNEKLAGYTKWIKVNNNETKFYIPPWAIENEYYEIKYRVEAYNVFDENGGDHSHDEEGTANDTLNGNHEAINYVATYVVPVELSGIIYNFEIIGTNNYADYNEELETGEVAFCPSKWEKKQGNRNRLGGTSVRYTLDGQITTAFPEENVLPLAMGNSPTWFDRGYLISGDTITFSVKTIANLWDEGIDSVAIKPTFKWFEADGTCHDNLQIYYWDDSNSNQLIRYGSELDLKELTTVEAEDNINTFSFHTFKVAGSVWDTEYTLDQRKIQFFTDDASKYTGNYHDQDLLYTVDWHNRNYEEQWDLGRFLWQKSNSYCMSAIVLNSQMRTLTGNYEELARNINKQRNELETFTLDAETEDKLKYSMQTWYGNYYIPTNMLICDADTFERLGATDTDGDGVIDYWDYLVSTDSAIDTSADFWLNNKGVPYGYLMLNFDIQTINNGKPHLSYYGGTKDMWKEQGSKDKVPMGDPFFEDVTNGEYPVIDVPVESGDIGLIKPEESIFDGYKPGIFMIN